MIDRTRGAPELPLGEGGVMRGTVRVSAWLAGIAICGLLACAQSPPPPADRQDAASTGPLLWRADAPDGRGACYLLGSVHLGNLRMREMNDAVGAAYASSDELVVEIDLSKVDPAEAQEMTLRFAMLPGTQTVEDVVSEETWLALAAYLDSHGLPREPHVRMKPWFVSLTIVQVELARAGYHANLGVDRFFIEEAVDSKPIVALETLGSQFEVLDSMSPEVGELMLSDTLSRANELADNTDKRVRAWEQGDDGRLQELVFDALDEAPELDVFYERVFYERNRGMAARLVELARDGKTRFVVLGAGHMLGEEGIPALLGRRGWSLRRVTP
jgi:uncharacterized protein YbaP (TraB family)